MAKLHNKAGQSHKERYRRLADLLLIGGAVLLLVLGALIGAFFANLHLPMVGLSLLVAAGGVAWWARRLGRMWDKMWRDRVSYLRGGQAEAFVAWLLYYLPDGWHVFNNLMIRPDQDLDHVVVGPGGLFAISTKGVRGLLSIGRGGELFLNDEPCDFARDAVRQGMQLRDLLSERLNGQNVPFVNAVLAAPLAYTRGTDGLKNVTVLHQGDLTEKLEKSPGRLKPAEVKRIVAALETFRASGEARPKAAATPPAGAA